jgi:hypothetical protein
MIVRDDLHGLFNLLVALVLKTLAVAVFTCVDTATKVIILWRRGWRSVCLLLDSGSRSHHTRTNLSPSAGTTSSIRSFSLISWIRRCRVYASSCSLVMLALIMVGKPIKPAALFSEASPQRFLFLRLLSPPSAGSAESHQ